MDQRRALIWALIALVAGLAIGIGAGALLSGGSDDNSGGSGSVDTAAIELPAQLGAFRDIVDVTTEKSKQSGDLARTHQADVKAATEAAYSKAYGGAAAGYREYSDDGLLQTPYVIAVRASTPGLTIGPVIDPAYLKQAKPPNGVETVGDVSCEILWDFVPEGETPKPSTEHVLNCQRSGSALTVFVGGSSFQGPAGLQKMAGLTNAAWTAIAG
jgi:hypothetical protein